MKNFLLSSIFFVLFSDFGYSQNLTGIWKGKLSMASTGCFPEYYIELQIQMAGTRIRGVSYHFYDSLNYMKEHFEGVYHPDQKTLNIYETGMITYKMRQICVPCIKKYTLTYISLSENNPKEEKLTGIWTGKAIDNKTSCDPGQLILIRQQNPSFTPEWQLPSSLANRTSELIQEIKTDSGVIQIHFYDNGQVDGDTISVYVNGKSAIHKTRLTEKPLSLTLYINHENPVLEVIMVGENMGAIPPNTALMTVMAAGKKYSMHLSSDEQKNSMVRFRYDNSLSGPKDSKVEIPGNGRNNRE
ncbi:MAG: hypothetical protein N2747_05845 [Chitinophagaceae bacterium]|nr:hypothetical protein [Chitinophagaceae bacterium]